MNIILFFTYDISLKDWEKSGLLDREIKFYKKLHEKYDIYFTFITFGDSRDTEIIDLPFIKVEPIYEYISYKGNKLLRFFQSLTIPFKIKSIIQDSSLIKTNQLMGSWIAIIAKAIYKKPLIIRTGYDLLTFSKKNKKGFYKIIFYSILTRLSLIYADIYLVSSKGDLEFLTKFSKKNSKKIKIRPNWVSKNESYSFNNRNKNNIISVGRLENQKNFNQLLSFFENSEYKIDIFGEGSLKEDLIYESKVKNVKLEIHNPIRNKDLLNILKSYKFFISTSLFEGNPKAILEAMASGCVVIAIENSNVVEIIENDFNGIIINEDTNLKLLLENLENDNKKWSYLSNNGISFINNYYLLEKIVEEEYKDYLLINNS